MKRIVIPTDFSRDAETAIERVFDVLIRTNDPCQVILLNTYLVQHTDPLKVIELNDESRKKSLEGLQKVKALCEGKAARTQVKVDIASHLGSVENVVRTILGGNRYDVIQRKNLDAIAAHLTNKEMPLLISN